MNVEITCNECKLLAFVTPFTLHDPEIKTSLIARFCPKIASWQSQVWGQGEIDQFSFKMPIIHCLWRLIMWKFSIFQCLITSSEMSNHSWYKSHFSCMDRSQVLRLNCILWSSTPVPQCLIFWHCALVLVAVVQAKDDIIRSLEAGTQHWVRWTYIWKHGWRHS